MDDTEPKKKPGTSDTMTQGESSASANVDLLVSPVDPDLLAPPVTLVGSGCHGDEPIRYELYESEVQMPAIMCLMKTALSEPYSIYTYRYFIHNWPHLCVLAMAGDLVVGAIVCKEEIHHYNTRRGYIAMLAVADAFRKKKIGSTLVKKTIHQMVKCSCDEVVLETEVTNGAALSLYGNLGFVRDKYLHKYYLNGVDAYRLKLWLRDPLDTSSYIHLT